MGTCFLAAKVSAEAEAEPEAVPQGYPDRHQMPLALRKKFGYMDPTDTSPPIRIKPRQRSSSFRAPLAPDSAPLSSSSHLQHRTGHHRTGQAGLEVPTAQQTQQPATADERFFLVSSRKRPFKRPRPQSQYGVPPKKRPLFKKPSLKKPPSHRPSPNYGAPAEPSYQVKSKRTMEVFTSNPIVPFSYYAILKFSAKSTSNYISCS